MAEKTAYTEAVTSGKYEKASGLLGKYDNVRRFWEDRLTGICLRPSLSELLARRSGSGVRILDLGCGSGDAYELIMGISSPDALRSAHSTALLTENRLQEYVGVDVNSELLGQAAHFWRDVPNMRFVCGDICGSLPPEIVSGQPFDLYFTSYGTLSHFHDEENAGLLGDICRHAPDNALIVCDWLGRYSYEWQDLWHNPADREYFMDYRISYIYPEEQRSSVEISSFPLRLMTRDEILRIVDTASQESGVTVRPLGFYDRSIFIGRHLDTGDYNRNCPKLRSLVNSLFEPNVRTDLEELRVCYAPRPGFEELNRFFSLFFDSCTALVDFTDSLLRDLDNGSTLTSSEPPRPEGCPEALKNTMLSMQQSIAGVGRIRHMDVRANVIEPLLAYGLRELELNLQPGTGVGHSLAGIFRIHT